MNFQHDNDPAHKLAISHINYWNRLHGFSVKLMFNLPPISPDLNPTENDWGRMGAKVNALEYTTWSDFNAAVHIICKEVTPTMMEN